MNETLSNLLVAHLKQSGQTSIEGLLDAMHGFDPSVIESELRRMTVQQEVKLSPRGMYYVQGHVKPQPKASKAVRQATSAVLRLGVTSATGTGFSVDDRIIVPGDSMTNRELIDGFRVSGVHGIRVSKSQGVILVVSSVHNGLYQDQWVDGVFRYTGEGRTGDQELTRGNAAMADSMSSGTPLLLFFKRGTNQYEFQGEAKLAGPPETEVQEDEDGSPRRVWVFPLALVGEGNPE